MWELAIGIAFFSVIGVALGAVVGVLPRRFRWLVLAPALAWVVYSVGLKEGWWLDLPSTDAWMIVLVFGVVMLTVSAFLGMVITSRVRVKH